MLFLTFIEVKRSLLLNLITASLFLPISCQEIPTPTPFETFLSGRDTIFDLAILNGVVVDGLGSEPINSDVLVTGDTIAFVGYIDTTLAKITQIIHAQERIICPGFIDPHAHGDPMSDESFENFLAMGVTTILLGQDGSSSVQQGNSALEYLAAVEDRPLLLNVAFLAGHGSIRTNVGVGAKRKPDAIEIRNMQQVLKESLEAGCFGMSTGLEYVPGMYADRFELVELAKTVGAYEGIIMSHMRSEDEDEIDLSIDELASQGEYCRVHISHLKVVYGKGREKGVQVIKKIKALNESGIVVTADVYPYLAGYTGISIVFPPWAKTPSTFIEAKRSRNAELRSYLKEKVLQRNGPEATLFGSGPFTGLTLAEVEKKSGKSFVDILLELGPFGASGAYFVMDQKLQDAFITDSTIMICTDGSPTMRHPRGYGTYARMIEDYFVRDSSITLPILIKKMTYLPAKTIGFRRRGQIAAGYAADLLIFNPSDIKERATFVEPHRPAEGFDLVFVNGKISWKNESIVRSDAGRLIRRNTGY
ncbi:MAG: amidohydrolase family protein [Saprospiraceae bacterium]|nr:amidohydrolase family protein [Saprospiraceae bacterium]